MDNNNTFYRAVTNATNAVKRIKNTQIMTAKIRNTRNMNTKISNIQSNLKELKGLKGLDTTVSNIQSNLNNLQTKINSKVEQSSSLFNKLTNSMDVINNNIKDIKNNNTNDINKLKNALNVINETINSQNELINSNTKSYNDLTRMHYDLAKKHSNLESNYIILKDSEDIKHSDLEGKYNKLEGRISTLEQNRNIGGGIRQSTQQSVQQQPVMKTITQQQPVMKTELGTITRQQPVKPEDIIELNYKFINKKLQRSEVLNLKLLKRIIFQHDKEFSHTFNFDKEYIIDSVTVGSDWWNKRPKFISIFNDENQLINSTEIRSKNKQYTCGINGTTLCSPDNRISHNKVDGLRATTKSLTLKLKGVMNYTHKGNVPNPKQIYILSFVKIKVIDPKSLRVQATQQQTKQQTKQQTMQQAIQQAKQQAKQHAIQQALNLIDTKIDFLNKRYNTSKSDLEFYNERNNEKMINRIENFINNIENSINILTDIHLLIKQDINNIDKIKKLKLKINELKTKRDEINNKINEVKNNLVSQSISEVREKLTDEETIYVYERDSLNYVITNIEIARNIILNTL